MKRTATKKTAASVKKAVRKATKKKAVTKRARTPPYTAYPEWTTAQFFSFLRSGLRAKFTRWPPKYKVLSNAKRNYTGSNPRQKYEFQCAECLSYYQQKQVEVDHIIACGSLNKLEDLPGFVERLFCGVEGLRVLCKPCHLKITKESKNV